jgi:hypothetical protein
MRTKAKDSHHRLVIISSLIQLGYKWHNKNFPNINEIEDRWPFNSYPIVQINASNKEISGNTGDYVKLVETTRDFYEKAKLAIRGVKECVR